MRAFFIFLYQAPAYYFSFFLFGIVGLALNCVSWCLGWLPATPRTERRFQRVLHRLFAAWVNWLSWARLVRFHFDDFSRLPRNEGLVMVSNHPGLMDITYLLAQVPAAVCVFKPAIRRNPVLGAAARRAGYVANDGGHDMLRVAAEKVAAGATFILFPEGTRSRAGVLNPFKPGFAIIARRAHAPIQLVRITCSPDLLVKGRAWWKIPRLPASVTVALGPCLPPPEDKKTDAMVSGIEAWFRTGASDHRPAPGAAAFVTKAPLRAAS